MRKITVTLISLLLCIPGVFCLMEEPAQATPPTWECEMSVSETTNGKIDSAWFGEAPDARDGPPHDAYDVVKPPLPMTPYVRASFSDNLEPPYDSLWKDYRQHPDTEKVWNLSVWWTGSSTTTVTITWNTTQLNASEYDYIVLKNSTGVQVPNMKITSGFVFTCPANGPQQFSITCTSNQPPNTPSDPSPGNQSSGVFIDADLSWTGGDPDGDLVTYDIYFGTNTTPSKVVTQQSALSFNPGALLYQTTYYWRIHAWDLSGANTSGPLWSFTTETSSGTPPGGGSPPPVNTPPIADASASETRGLSGTALLFNGSRSSDSDGYITSWVWSFGDGSDGDGELISHVYDNTGVYTVTLTVTDNNGATDSDTLPVTIVSANNPPSSPVVEGITLGEKNTRYTFTVRSTDADNDSLQYQVTWGDSSQNTSSFLPNGTSYTCAHAWSSPGKYLITATASDSITVSEQTTCTVFIDVHFIGTLGFLYDTDGDETFDVFYVNATSSATTVTMLTNGSYVLTVDGEAPAEYLYNPVTGALSLWEPQEPSEIGTNTVLIVVVSSIVVILVLLCVVYLFNKKHRK